MLEFQEKRKLRKYLYSKVTLILLLLLIIFATNAVWKVYKKQAVTKDNLAKTAASLTALQVREKMLSSEIERLKTDSGVEAEIRERYGLVKPNEEVITVVDKASGTDSNDASPEVGFWQKVLNWLK